MQTFQFPSYWKLMVFQFPCNQIGPKDKLLSRISITLKQKFQEKKHNKTTLLELLKCIVPAQFSAALCLLSCYPASLYSRGLTSPFPAMGQTPNKIADCCHHRNCGPSLVRRDIRISVMFKLYLCTEKLTDISMSQNRSKCHQKCKK